MQLDEIEFRDVVPVEGYGPGFFRVAGDLYHGGLLMLPRQMRVWQGFEDLADILAAAGDLDVLFVGTGSEIAYLPEAFRTTLEAAEIGVETMNSPAACRTYNVLLGEGRRVGLAALPVS